MKNESGLQLNEVQLRRESAQHLLTLLEEISADGYLSDEEILQLGEWLEMEEDRRIPAMTFLRSLIGDILSDNAIVDSERLEILHAVLRIMPDEESRIARLRIGYVTRCTDLHAQDMLATKEQIQLMKILGIEVRQNCSSEQASELLREAIEKRHTLSGKHLMVLRFWNREELAKNGSRFVSLWLDNWYRGDPDRYTAWSLWNRDHPECCFPENLEAGAGFEYLVRVKAGRR
jgi:hypothetical protein